MFRRINRGGGALGSNSSNSSREEPKDEEDAPQRIVVRSKEAGRRLVQARGLISASAARIQQTSTTSTAIPPEDKHKHTHTHKQSSRSRSRSRSRSNDDTDANKSGAFDNEDEIALDSDEYNSVADDSIDDDPSTVIKRSKKDVKKDNSVKQEEEEEDEEEDDEEMRQWELSKIRQGGALNETSGLSAEASGALAHVSLETVTRLPSFAPLRSLSAVKSDLDTQLKECLKIKETQAAFAKEIEESIAIHKTDVDTQARAVDAAEEQREIVQEFAEYLSEYADWVSELTPFLEDLSKQHNVPADVFLDVDDDFKLPSRVLERVSSFNKECPDAFRECRVADFVADLLAIHVRAGALTWNPISTPLASPLRSQDWARAVDVYGQTSAGKEIASAMLRALVLNVLLPIWTRAASPDALLQNAKASADFTLTNPNEHAPCALRNLVSDALEALRIPSRSEQQSSPQSLLNFAATFVENAGVCCSRLNAGAPESWDVLAQLLPAASLLVPFAGVAAALVYRRALYACAEQLGTAVHANESIAGLRLLAQFISGILGCDSVFPALKKTEPEIRLPQIIQLLTQQTLMSRAEASALCTYLVSRELFYEASLLGTQYGLD